MYKQDMKFSMSLEEELPSLSELYKDYKNWPGTRYHFQGTDKGTEHTYVEEYERLLKPYRTKSTVLELGIYTGYSLQLWQDYFLNSEIIGVDINIALAAQNFPNRKFKLIQEDATRPSLLDKLGDKTFDVVIDDGSHKLEDQKISFNILKNRMNPGGIYIVEDVIDIDRDKSEFISLHDNCEIIDIRHKNKRDNNDNVLVVYRF